MFRNNSPDKKPDASKELKSTSFFLVPGATLDDHKFLCAMKDFEKNVPLFLDDLPRSVQEIPEIGRGATSEVFKAVFHNKTVALKVLRDRITKEYMNEISVMKQLHSDNVVKLIGTIFNKRRSIIILEYCANGKLTDWLKKHQDISYGEQLRLAIGINEGLVEIHKAFVHGDFSSNNVFLDESNNPKIGDFGFSFKTSKSISEQKQDGSPGTLEYAAPELFDHDLRSTKSDIYSFGVVLWEISTQKKFTLAMSRKVSDERNISSLLKDIPIVFQELIKACWQTNPEQRPSAKMIAYVLHLALNELNQETEVATDEPKIGFRNQR